MIKSYQYCESNRINKGNTIIRNIIYLMKSTINIDIQYEYIFAPDKYNKCLTLLILSFNGLDIIYPLNDIIEFHIINIDIITKKIFCISSESFPFIPLGIFEYFPQYTNEILYSFSNIDDNIIFIVAWK